MNDNELYRQRYQAQLDEWHADIAKLRARVAMAKADAQIAMNKEIAALERRLENYQSKLAELAVAREDAWDSVKSEVESAWDAMTSAVSDAVSKFKD